MLGCLRHCTSWLYKQKNGKDSIKNVKGGLKIAKDVFNDVNLESPRYMLQIYQAKL